MGVVHGRPVLQRHDEDLRETVRDLAQRVAELETKTADEATVPPPLGFSDDKLAAIATSMYRSRQRRARYFEAALLGEPAWDMLLDLFINKVRSARVSTTSLCLAANVPQATGLRWINLLSDQGLLRRFRAPDDARLVLIEITPKGYQLMRQFLSDSVTRFDVPRPR